MELPQLDGVTHRTVVRPRPGASTSPRPAPASPSCWCTAGRSTGGWRHVVPLLAPHGAAGHARPARLRVVRRPARRLRQADAGRRPARGARRARARARAARRPTTGARGSASSPGVAAPRALRGVPRAGLAAPAGQAARARQVLQIWRFAYQVVLAAPVLGRRVVANERFMARVIAAGAVRREAWTADDVGAFTTVLAEPARARASVPALPHLPHARGGAHARGTATHADTDHGRRRRPRDPPVPARGRRARRRRPRRRDRARIAGTSCPRSAQSWSPSVRVPFSGSVDPESRTSVQRLAVSGR